MRESTSSVLRTFTSLLLVGAALICAPPAAAEDAASAMQHHLDAARKARTANDWESANTQFDKAVELAVLLEAGDSRIVRALEEAARAYQHQKDGARAIELQEQAVEHQRAGGKAPDNALAESLYRLGRLYREFDAGEQAEVALREALEIREALQPDNVHTTQMRRDLSKTIQSLRPDDADAEELLLRDLEQGDTASRREHLGRYFAQTERHEPSITNFLEAIAIERELPLPSGRRLVSLLTSLATEHQKAGQPDRAEAALLEAIALREDDMGPEHPYLAFTLRQLAGLYIEEERWQAAQTALLRARDLNAEAWGEKYHECSCTTGDLLARVQAALGLTEAAPARAAGRTDIGFKIDNPAAAELPEAAEQALEIEDVGADEGHEADALIREHEESSRRQRKLGNIEAAKDAAGQALALREETYGADSLQAAFGLERLGRLWKDQQRFDEAVAMFERSLAILEARLDADDPRIGATLGVLGQLERSRNNHADAERYLLTEVNLRETIGQRIQAARTLETLGSLNLTRQLPARAEANFVRAIELWEDFAGVQAPEVMRNTARLAQAYLKLDRVAEAEPLLADALEREQAKRYPDTGLLIQLLQPLKTVLERTGRADEAQAVESRLQELRNLRAAALEGPRPAAKPAEQSAPTRAVAIERRAR